MTVRGSAASAHAFAAPATVLNEIALTADAGIVIDEARLPVRPEVNGACEILGIDPLYVANEGKLMAIVAPEASAAALAALASHELGVDTEVVGHVREAQRGSWYWRPRSAGGESSTCSWATRSLASADAAGGLSPIALDLDDYQHSAQCFTGLVGLCFFAGDSMRPAGFEPATRGLEVRRSAYNAGLAAYSSQ